MATEDRKLLIEKLSQELNIYEATSLVAMIHEKSSSISKSKRFGIFPVEDWGSFARTKALEASRWTADRVNFTGDRGDYNALTEEERKPLERAFGFFAVGDGSVASMIAYKMLTIAPSLEAQQFYMVQLDNERVHAETYGKMINTLISDSARRDEIFNAIEKVESIGKMTDLINEAFLTPDGERDLYVHLAAAEYLMFTPLFCIIFWYRAYKRGKLQGVIFSNEEIAKDEAVHCMNGCANYINLPNSDRYTDEEIWKVVDKFVKAVSDFADETLEGTSLEELTPENVKQYIKYVADDLLDRLGHQKLYKCSSPFKWMDFTNLVPKTNFYEAEVGEYQNFNVSEAIEEAKRLSSVSSDQDDQERSIYDNIEECKF